ncbi:hypothetical protein Sipo7851_29155 [Streptomyces ipomoeae]|nr:hypothetical protein Sipo7851_29155 [Streptomyces ipomoeae]
MFIPVTHPAHPTHPTGDHRMLPGFPPTYEVLLDRVTTDPAVVGLVLKGSHAHDGMATERSDHDVYVVLDDGADSDLARLHGHRSAELDVVVVTFGAFRELGGYERYALARAHVVLDRLDGRIAEVVSAQARLDADAAFQEAAGLLDAYANSVYRSVKNARDGHRLAALLDAADSVRFLLDLLFTLHRRPRPYNKYLEWELERFPLPGWETKPLLDTVARITATGHTDEQRRLFGQVEAAAREAGHGPVLDAWGEDLRLMRPGPTAGTR